MWQAFAVFPDSGAVLLGQAEVCCDVTSPIELMGKRLPISSVSLIRSFRPKKHALFETL